MQHILIPVGNTVDRDMSALCSCHGSYTAAEGRQQYCHLGPGTAQTSGRFHIL